ncbi:MAG: hypothetical protein QM493_07935 [Sulfurovum sp.]
MKKIIYGNSNFRKVKINNIIMMRTPKMNLMLYFMIHILVKIQHL